MELKDLDLICYTSELNVIRILLFAFMILNAFKHRILNLILIICIVWQLEISRNKYLDGILSMKGSLVKLFMTYPGYLYTEVLCTVLATMCTPTLLLWFTRHNIVTNVAAYCDGDYIFRDNPTESRTPGHPVPCQEWQMTWGAGDL